jgi:hypothetical protein
VERQNEILIKTKEIEINKYWIGIMWRDWEGKGRNFDTHAKEEVKS